MAEWALLYQGKEIATWRGQFDDELRKACEDEAIGAGIGARLPKGFALVPDAEIVKMAE